MSQSPLLLAASVLVLSACQPAADAPEELVVETPPVVEDVAEGEMAEIVEAAAEETVAEAAVVEVAAEAEEAHDHGDDHDHSDEEDHDHDHGEDGHDHDDDHDHEGDHDHGDDHDHDHAGGEAHVHGLSDLAASLEGSTLSISIEGALANFDLDESLREISNPETYATGTVDVVGGECSPASSDVSVRPIGDHGNLMIDLSYECADAGNIEAIEVTGFSSFAGFEEVNAVYLTETGQVAETLTESDTRLDLN